MYQVNVQQCDNECFEPKPIDENKMEFLRLKVAPLDELVVTGTNVFYRRMKQYKIHPEETICVDNEPEDHEDPKQAENADVDPTKLF